MPETVTTTDLFKVIYDAIRCGKIVRDTFGGNVGGGKDVFQEAYEAVKELEKRYANS